MMPQGQGGGYGPLGMLLTPWVKRLMIATAALSIFGVIANKWLGVPFLELLTLNPLSVWGRGVLPGIPTIWQLVTYPFFLVDPIGLIFAILLYGWFAGSMEAWWGSKRFLRFVALVVLGSAVVSVLLALVWPRLAITTIAGPYPLLEGLIVAWGLTFPEREVRLYFILPVKGIHLVWITVGIVGVYILFSGNVASFVPQLVGMGIAAATVSGTWRFGRLRLRVKKLIVEARLKMEREKRKRRVEDARHLRVVDEDKASDDDRRKDGGDGTPGDGTHGGGWIN